MFARSTLWTTVGLGALVMALVGSIWLQSGRVGESGGLGYDGEIYATMTTEGLDVGGDNPRMRPLVVAVNQLVYRLSGDVIRAFQVMNLVYSGLLAVLLVAILRMYRVSMAHIVLFVLNVFATIALVKMFAFYPVLVDLGAYFFVTLAVFAILRGHRAAIIACTILAVMAREFGLVAVLFGIHRAVRLRVPAIRIASMYAPALVAFAALRVWVTATSQQPDDLTGLQGGLLSWSDALSNLAAVANPVFLVFFGYFALTVFGGVSLLVCLRAITGRLRLDGEMEWITYAVLIVLLACAGSADLWRYLAYGLPAVAVFYAKSVAMEDWRLIAPWAALATVFTQRPWVRMNDTSYFEDWFPLYLPQLGIPEPPTPEFWMRWSLRIAVVLGICIMAWIAQRPRAAVAGVSGPSDGDWRIVAPWGGLVTVMVMQLLNAVSV